MPHYQGGASNPKKIIALWRRRSREKERQETSCDDRRERRRLRKQADIYEQLADEHERLSDLSTQLNWAHEKVAEDADPKLNPAPDQAYKTYARLMRLAARNGLREEDSTIDRWFRIRRAIGDKWYLRTVKKGWETGVQPPYSELEMEIIRHAQKGKKRSEIRRILISQERLSPRTSPQNFCKQYKRLWESFYINPAREVFADLAIIDRRSTNLPTPDEGSYPSQQ